MGTLTHNWQNGYPLRTISHDWLNAVQRILMTMEVLPTSRPEPYFERPSEDGYGWRLWIPSGLFGGADFPFRVTAVDASHVKIVGGNWTRNGQKCTVATNASFGLAAGEFVALELLDSTATYYPAMFPDGVMFQSFGAYQTAPKYKTIAHRDVDGVVIQDWWGGDVWDRIEIPDAEIGAEGDTPTQRKTIEWNPDASKNKWTLQLFNVDLAPATASLPWYSTASREIAWVQFDADITGATLKSLTKGTVIEIYGFSSAPTERFAKKVGTSVDWMTTYGTTPNYISNSTTAPSPGVSVDVARIDHVHGFTQIVIPDVQAVIDAWWGGLGYTLRRLGDMSPDDFVLTGAGP